MSGKTEFQGGARYFHLQFINLHTLIKESNLYGNGNPNLFQGNKKHLPEHQEVMYVSREIHRAQG